MYTLIVYDSAHGNTKTIAEEIGKQFNPESTAVMPVSVMNKIDLSRVDLFIVGSPTYGGRPMTSIQKYIASIPENGLCGKKIAAFDTRFKSADHGIGLKVLMKIIGYAAPRIEKALNHKGGFTVVPAMGFFVKDKQGPLNENELERAKAWAHTIADSLV